MAGGRTVARRALWACLGTAGLSLLCGCAMLNSFLDPTTVGAFPLDYKEQGIRRVLTPRETPPGIANASEPTPEDLVVDYEDYRIGPGDQVAVVIEDLLVQGQPEATAVEVSPSGYIRLNELGSMKATGITEQELEQEIKAQLKAMNKLPNPIVRVFVQLKRQRFFTIIGNVNAAGPYSINDPDTRLLDAIGVARDVDANVKRLYVIRRENKDKKGGTSKPTENGVQPKINPEGLVIPPPVEEEDRSPGSFFAAVGATAQDVPASRPKQPGEMQTLEDIIAPQRHKPPAQPPPDVKRESDRPFAPLIFDPQQQAREAKPEKPTEPQPQPGEARRPQPPKKNGFEWENAPELELAQRVIEIDVRALKSGDPRFNIVLRNRDVVQVPVDTGVFYLMGEISRPGVYALGGRDVSIKQAVAIGGGLTPLAWPQRCEIIRREAGSDKEVLIPVNVDAIFASLEQDVLLRDDDIINFGTHFVAPFLFVIRNSFRFTYGFGFVYDRNFADKDAYGGRANPESLALQRRQQRGLPF